MTEYLSSSVKGYLSHYSGMSASCWQRIGVSLANSTAGGTCFFLSLYFVKNLQFSIFVSGILISIYGLGTAFGGIISGRLSDKMSPNIVSIVSLLLSAMAFLLFIKLKTVHLLVANIFILGMANYGFKTSNNVWMLKNSGKHKVERLKMINVLYTTSNLGIGISAVVVSLFSQYGFHYIFLFSGALLFLSAIYLIFQEKNKVHLSEDCENKADIALNNKFGEEASKKNIKIFWLTLICLFWVGLIIVQGSATYPVFIYDAFPLWGVKAVAILFTLNAFLIALFQVPAVNFFRHNNKVFMIGIGAFLIGLGIFVLGFSPVFLLAIISCIIYTTGEMLFMSFAQYACYEHAAENKKGQSIGMFQSTYATSVVIGPTVGSFIYHTLGANTLWYLSGTIGLICLFACIVYMRHD